MPAKDIPLGPPLSPDTKHTMSPSQAYTIAGGCSEFYKLNSSFNTSNYGSFKTCFLKKFIHLYVLIWKTDQEAEVEVL